VDTYRTAQALIPSGARSGSDLRTSPSGSSPFKAYGAYRPGLGIWGIPGVRPAGSRTVCFIRSCPIPIRKRIEWSWFARPPRWQSHQEPQEHRAVDGGHRATEDGPTDRAQDRVTARADLHARTESKQADRRAAGDEAGQFRDWPPGRPLNPASIPKYPPSSGHRQGDNGGNTG
jgi:hypothetical protein